MFQEWLIYDYHTVTLFMEFIDLAVKKKSWLTIAGENINNKKY